MANIEKKIFKKYYTELKGFVEVSFSGGKTVKIKLQRDSKPDIHLFLGGKSLVNTVFELYDRIGKEDVA